MIPRVDLFHQIAHEDDRFSVIVDYTDTIPNYDVYEKQTGEWIGCTNCHYYMPQIRQIIKYRLQWEENIRQRAMSHLGSL